MIRLSHILGIVGMGAVLTVVLFPLFAKGTRCGVQPTCLSNVKHVALGLIQYAADADDRLPSREDWVDSTYPYVKNWGIYRCPLRPSGAWGYAFDGALSHAKIASGPSELPMVYDSINPAKNASDLVTSLPKPGRHKGRVNVAYADGHAWSVVVQ